MKTIHINKMSGMIILSWVVGVVFILGSLVAWVFHYKGSWNMEKVWAFQFEIPVQSERLSTAGVVSSTTARENAIIRMTNIVKFVMLIKFVKIIPCKLIIFSSTKEQYRPAKPLNP